MWEVMLERDLEGLRLGDSLRVKERETETETETGKRAKDEMRLSTDATRELHLHSNLHLQ